MNIKGISDEVLQRFKAYCNLQGKSMQEVVVDFMREKGQLVQLKK